MANKEFKFTLSGTRSTTTIRSQSLFDLSYQEPTKPPIDIYESNILSYKRLLGCFILEPATGSYTSLASQGNEEWAKLSNLLILGFISSVESYVRCLLRRLLLIDNESKKRSYSKSVTYGAAVHHNKQLLPEALMEDCSFHSATNIKETIKSVTGVNLSNLKKNPELATAFSDFDFIGQLRHCVVHRSGLFGSNNALSLGLDEYHEYLEKPIKLEFTVVQEAAKACDTLVKELNDTLFKEFLNRSINMYDWKGDLRSDAKYFDKYFDVFSPSESKCLRLKCYHEFRDVHNLRYRNGQR
ncbi:hypothetical protein VIBNISFn27_80056 [Vibrio nigripulchritudo SFn27]|uniref:RiboL-PSP-HEPN domain-containing protein n=1 Tax=Vibrio nigripulchritudo TaxID=28173 RepID=U4K395_9VIBR|nr:hypothetical protein [Vibrio nigripulchritudo]CCN83487.1 hypothetical protein VIBNIBLFn1_610005 [Vibrio nigripulchritudo BLFn1]CCN90975.1 hypothetical protein VIBNISFn27_80056 [Vibrio nigripulchritudo SFn27]CCN95201.1 hypothetical protein VIBNIENn2_490059 [Vibrio nigripulchritudo ENn2]CCO42321.1 hypothetical protein VIBNISFn135_800058 [Vibrio nigripulchritudo SFn135]CCO52216.1 hypothetical protein VIBNIWn13_260058 [Vibrio nigripulchritudo Wn13]